jgi:PAS domain S-box-containing protein
VAAPGTTTSGADAWGGAGDPLDFDLLAEYLLDDGAAGAGDLDVSFDFNVETPPINPADQAGSTVVSVSPEQQAEISFADPLADATAHLASSGGGGSADGDIAGDLAQVQQMIATQAAAMSTTKSGPSQSASSASSSKFKTGASRPSAPTGLPPMPPYGGSAAPSHAGAAPSAFDSNKRRRVDVSAPLTATSTAVSGMAHSSLPTLPPHKGGRQKSQAQIDRRRERNRILARRTRLRKKFFFESLQKDVADLQRENALLKELVRNRLQPDIAGSILEQCKANEEMPSVISEQGHGIMDERDHNFIQSVQKSQQCFVITDPSLQDNPIVYASDDFLTLTGYSREEVLGRNCRFLQGNETSRSKIAQIRKALENGDDCSVTLINYAADGTAFWNNLFIAALRDAENNIVNFIGVIVKVAGPEPGDAEHGVKLPGENSPTSAMDPDVVDSAVDADAAAKAAEGTLMGLEGAVTAAVAAAPSLAK